MPSDWCPSAAFVTDRDPVPETAGFLAGGPFRGSGENSEGGGASLESGGASLESGGASLEDDGARRGRCRLGDTNRGTAPLGVALLVAIAVLLAGVVAGATVVVPSSPPTAALSVSAADDRVTLVHRGGDRLDVGDLGLVVRVDGEELDRQPPVPFFSAKGFRPGPTGPFNAAADQRWRAGETASFRVAETNAPTLATGATVEVDVYVGDHRIASLSTRVA